MRFVASLMLILAVVTVVPAYAAPSAPDRYRLIYFSLNQQGNMALYQVDVHTFASTLYVTCPSPTCTNYLGQANGNVLKSSTYVTTVTRHGQLDLIVSDDGVLHLLAHTSGDDYMGHWSPDGKRVVFYSVQEQPQSETDLYVINADGSEQWPVTNTDEYTEENPVWSPQGDWIAFERRLLAQGGSYIYRIRPDGTDLQQVSPQNGSGADWSPDGQWIAYSSYRDGSEIYVAAADGSSERQLTSTAGYDEHPLWSPDGQWIAFESASDGNSDIYVVSADGSQEIQLTQSADSEIDPMWMATASTDAAASTEAAG
jgi:Tol biopolymer transport system component